MDQLQPETGAGRFADAVTLPPELAAGVATAVLDAFGALRPPPPRAGGGQIAEGAAAEGAAAEGAAAATSGAWAPDTRQRAS